MFTNDINTFTRIGVSVLALGAVLAVSLPTDAALARDLGSRLGSRSFSIPKATKAASRAARRAASAGRLSIDTSRLKGASSKNNLAKRVKKASKAVQKTKIGGGLKGELASRLKGSSLAKASMNRTSKSGDSVKNSISKSRLTVRVKPDSRITKATKTPKITDVAKAALAKAGKGYNGTPRVDEGERHPFGSSSANAAGSNANALPYDEFRETGSAAASAPAINTDALATAVPDQKDVLTNVPGLTLANWDKLNRIKENAGGFQTYFPGDGRPGGAAALEVMPGRERNGLTLTMPDGTEWSQPEGIQSHFDPYRYFGDRPEPNERGSKDSPAVGTGGSALTVIGSGASAALGNRSGSQNSGPMLGLGGERVMQGGDDSDGYTFTLAEIDAEDPLKLEQDGKIVDYEDGSANVYGDGVGAATVTSYNANGEVTQTTYHHKGDGEVVTIHYDDSPCQGPDGPGDCGEITGSGSDPEDIESAIKREKTGQPNPEATTGGVVLIGPRGRRTSGNDDECRTARCNEFGDENEVNVRPALWNAFNISTQVVNPTPQP
jgi:hypothetical protein